MYARHLPYNVAGALAYGGITYQLRDDLAAMRDTVAELFQRYYFAYYREWGLILDSWSRPGASLFGRRRRDCSAHRA